MTSCSDKNRLQEDSLRIAGLSAELEQATDYKDSLMLIMGDIYMGLDSINMQEGLLNNMGAGDNHDRRGEIRTNLENIRRRLAQNRELLAEMEAKLGKQNGQNKVLVQTIERLKAQIESQNTRIIELESALVTARGTIDTLRSDLAYSQEQVKNESAEKEKAQQEAVAANNQLNRCWYAIGTANELKNNKLLEKKFLGSTKVLRGDFNEAYFTAADKRTLSSIPCNSKKVKIWTNHPAGSCEIVENADKTKTIKILDAVKFWSLSDHLIVQID